MVIHNYLKNVNNILRLVNRVQKGTRLESGEAGTEIPALIIFAKCFLAVLAGDRSLRGSIPLIYCF